MQVSTAPDLASKGQGISDSSNVKVKGEMDDHHFQSETNVRCLCGSQLETESMIKVSTDFLCYIVFLIVVFSSCNLEYEIGVDSLCCRTNDGLVNGSVRIENVKCGSTLIV